MAIRTTDEIIESLLADEGVLLPARAPEDDALSPAARERRPNRRAADRGALADALRAVLDFDE